MHWVGHTGNRGRIHFFILLVEKATMVSCGLCKSLEYSHEAACLPLIIIATNTETTNQESTRTLYPSPGLAMT